VCPVRRARIAFGRICCIFMGLRFVGLRSSVFWFRGPSLAGGLAPLLPTRDRPVACGRVGASGCVAAGVVAKHNPSGPLLLGFAARAAALCASACGVKRCTLLHYDIKVLLPLDNLHVGRVVFQVQLTEVNCDKAVYRAAAGFRASRKLSRGPAATCRTRNGRSSNWEIAMNPVPSSQLLTSEEVSTWLRIPKSSLYKLCKQGKIPVIRLGKHWRFDRRTLERWLARGANMGNEPPRPIRGTGVEV